MRGLQMLQHVWTYKPMVHDVLGMQSNSITVEEKGGAGVLPGASTKKRYEVSHVVTHKHVSATMSSCAVS